MMKRVKQWLITRFLPVWAKETLLKEYDKLLRENAALKAKIKEQEAYIDGLQVGIRNQRRIIINNGEASK